MRGPGVVVCLLSLGICGARAQPPAPTLWSGLAPGRHAVGFTSVLERDSSRRVEGKPRPEQVSCWFPAAERLGAPLTFRDYFLLTAAERGPASAQAGQAAIDDEKKFFASVGVAGSLVDRWLDQPVYARGDAAPAAGPFPLVLVAQGNGQSAYHQAVLSEFLASHGFIVCTTPSQVRLGDVMASESDVLPSAAAQAADLAVAERSARGRFRTRPERAALVGHSFGARSAFLYAARHGAAALVSLDGGIGAAEARTWIDGAAIDRARFGSPVLHLYEEGDRAITPELGLIKSLTGSNRTLVRIDAMRHIDFTSLGFAASAVAGLTGPQSPALATRLRAVGQYTVQFLERAVARQPFLPPIPAEPWIHVESLPAER